jgi:hypothetical protein
MSTQVRQWAGRHKHLSAAILIGAVSFIWLVIGGPAAAESNSALNRMAGALATSLFLVLIVYVSISFVQRLRAESEMVLAVMYTLTTVALILLSFFVFIWIIKRMWEAA